MKQLLITIAAVVLVGGGESVPDISIYDAAIGGNIEAVEKHLAAGGDVNAKNDVGATPLLNATSKGHNEIAELLIDKGADVNAKDAWGKTPLDIAILNDHADTAAIIRTHIISIHDAARSGNIVAVKDHLYVGTDLNTPDGRGLTPLHVAAWRGQRKIAELLIAKSANVNAKDVDGETPLDRAIKYKKNEIADLLLQHGGKTGEELKAEGK